jgi:hypothetical protein
MLPIHGLAKAGDTFVVFEYRLSHPMRKFGSQFLMTGIAK